MLVVFVWLIGVAPAHHRPARRREHDDFVDADLREFLHRPLGAITLHGHEGNGNTLRWRGLALHVTGRTQRAVVPLADAPGAATITRRHLFAVTQAQHAGEVVLIVVVEHRCRDIGDKNVRGRVAQSGGHERAVWRSGVTRMPI